MRLDENLQERRGTTVPNTIQVLERATRNDDGSIKIVPTNFDYFNVTQRSSASIRPPPTMCENPLQPPYQRLPLQMITSNIARRADEGVPASLPLQTHPKQMSTLDELLLHPPHINGKKGRLQNLTHPKQVGLLKSHKQLQSANMMLEHRIIGGGKQIIGDMRKYYSSMYDHRIPRTSGLLHTLDEEPLTPTTSNSNQLKRSAAGCVDKPLQNKRQATTRFIPSSNCELDNRIENYLSLNHRNVNPLGTSTHLLTHKKINENSCSEMVDYLPRNRSTNWENLKIGSSHKHLPTIHNSCYNGIKKAPTIQREYPNLTRSALEGSSKIKTVDAENCSERKRIQPRTSRTEVVDAEPIYPSSEFFINTLERCKNKEFGKNKRFCCSPKLHSSNSKIDDKLNMFMKEQSVCYKSNAFETDDNAQMSVQSAPGCDPNQMITSFNYEITKFSVSLVPEDLQKTQDLAQEFDNESVLSNSGHLSDNEQLLANSI